jgi:DNA-directed RNA polymerase specialized sigma24 family protein
LARPEYRKIGEQFWTETSDSNPELASLNCINPGVGRSPAFSPRQNSQAIKSEGDLDDLGNEVAAVVDLHELILEDSLKLDRAWEARATPLYIQLRRRHTWWMYKLFRTRAWNDADVEELINETFRRYMESLRGTFWATHGVDPQSEPIFEDGKLIGLSLLPAKPITDLESYTFNSPGGWLRSVATSVLNKYANKAAVENQGAKEFRLAAKPPARRKAVNGKYQGLQSSWLVDYLYAPPRNMEERLVAECRAREIRERYVAALTNLPPVQRAAWVLCKDELLTHDEAEQMLAPILHWRTARAALRRKPLPDAEVSFLLSRKDVSPDTSKASNKLGEQLSDLDPSRASHVPVIRWSREYLGLTRRYGSFRSLRPLCVRFEPHGQQEQAGSISDRDRDSIRGMGLQRQDESTRLLKQESTCAYTLDLKPGWVKAPEPDAPEYVELLQKIRKLLKARKRCTTIAKILNTTHVPPVFGNTWHHTAVRLIASRARLIKAVRVSQSTPSASPAKTQTKPTPRRTAGKRAADAFHPSDDASHKAPGHSQAGKKVSGRRKRVRKAKQRSMPAQKARRNTRRWSKRPRKAFKKAATRRKTSKKVSAKAASLPKALRRGSATKKARLKRSVAKREKKRARRVHVGSARRQRH